MLLTFNVSDETKRVIDCEKLSNWFGAKMIACTRKDCSTVSIDQQITPFWADVFYDNMCRTEKVKKYIWWHNLRFCDWDLRFWDLWRKDHFAYNTRTGIRTVCNYAIVVNALYRKLFNFWSIFFNCGSDVGVAILTHLWNWYYYD